MSFLQQSLSPSAVLVDIGSWRQRQTGVSNVADAARYLVAAGSAPDFPGGIFDLPPTEVLTHKELIELMVRILGKRPIIIRLPSDDRRFGAQILARITGEMPSFVRSIMTMASANVLPGACERAPLMAFAPTPVDTSLERLLFDGMEDPATISEAGRDSVSGSSNGSDRCSRIS